MYCHNDVLSNSFPTDAPTCQISVPSRALRLGHRIYLDRVTHTRVPRPHELLRDSRPGRVSSIEQFLRPLSAVSNDLILRNRNKAHREIS